MKAFGFITFHLANVVRRQPVATGAFVLALLAAVVATTNLLYSTARNDAARAALEVARVYRPLQVANLAPPTEGRVKLPLFSSAAFGAQFHALALDFGLAPDEVAYSLEVSPTQPYWRYRVSFEVKADYSQIRKFIAAMSVELPHVALDAIRCRREPPVLVGLTCDLTLSAFFRGDRG